MLVDSVTMVTVEVVNCLFVANHATEFGGGAYVTFHTTAKHLITFRSCDFEDNVSENHAGGLEIEFSENGNGPDSNSVVVKSCMFHGNRAVYGGAVYIFHIIGNDDIILMLGDIIIFDGITLILIV